MQDPEAYHKDKAEKELHNPGDKGFERTSYQSQTPRRPRSDCQGQSSQGQVNQSPQLHAQGQYIHAQADHLQAIPQMKQATLPMNEIFREYSDTYVQQKPMSSQFSSEYVSKSMAVVRNSNICRSAINAKTGIYVASAGKYW